MKTLKLKAINRRDGICMLNVGGRYCTMKARYRGLCRGCMVFLQNYAFYDQIALPNWAPRDQEYKVKKLIKPGIYRIVANKEPCFQAVYARGLCRSHHSNFHQRGTLDALGLPAYQKKPK